LRFSILGPLEVRAAGADAGPVPLPLGPRKQRILLALMLCRAPAVVPVDQLVDALWADEPPPTAQKNIQVYMSHLRRLLSPGDEPERIRYRPPGYQILLSPAEFDVATFDDLVRTGRLLLRQGNAEPAARTLRSALSLWRGPALPELASVPALRAETARFDERRVGAFEDYLEAELALGHHGEVLDQVEAYVHAHPLRERLRSWQLVALYRSGRQAEALAEYDNLRRALARDLGLQPSPALRRLYQSILSGSPSLDGGWVSRPSPPPAAEVTAHLCQLPRDIDDFTDREQLVAGLRDALGAGEPAARRRLATICGPPGVGKTALAVHVAHLLRDRYPDGQVLVPMRADDGTTRPAAEAVGGLLRLLGLPESALPASEYELTAVLRAWLTERRMLLLLDDASDEAHVRPLLPGAGTSAAVVTGRTRLGALESAYHVHVPPFTPAAGLVLLGGLVGAARLHAAPAAAQRILAACGLLPLAVRIAGATLAGRPQLTVDAYADRLADEHRLLDELTVGDLAFRSVMDGFVRGLPPADQDTFARLGLLPGPVVTAAALATVLDLPEPAAARQLERLGDLNVVVPAAGPAAGAGLAYLLPTPMLVYARERLAAALGVPAG
jgi:DNA-binding SARP family transcriptional activator